MVLGEFYSIPLEPLYWYQQVLTTDQNLTTSANREFTQNQTPLARHFHRIHTRVVLGQSRRIPLGNQYRYQQSLCRVLNLTTSANREFTQTKTPLARHFHRIHTRVVLNEFYSIPLEHLYYFAYTNNKMFRRKRSSKQRNSTSSSSKKPKALKTRPPVHLLRDRFGYPIPVEPVLMYDMRVQSGTPRPINIDNLISYKSRDYNKAVQEVNDVVSKLAEDLTIDNTRTKQYFENMKVASSGGHASVGKSRLFDSLDVIVKKGKVYEAVGLEFYNLLVLSDLCEYIPHFPLPYMYFTCLSNTDKDKDKDKDTIQFCEKPHVEQADIDTITEEAEDNYDEDDIAPKLREFIIMEVAGTRTLKQGCTSEEECLSVILQVMFSLHIAQTHSKFTHYDLHTENIMLRNFDTENKNVWFYYKVNEINYEVPLINNSLAMLIDFGMSHCEELGRKKHLARMHWSEEQLSAYQKYVSITEDDILTDTYIPFVDHIKFLLLVFFNNKYAPKDLMPIIETFNKQYRINQYRIPIMLRNKDTPATFGTPLSVINFVIETEIFKKMVMNNSGNRTVYQWNKKGKRGLCKPGEC